MYWNVALTSVKKLEDVRVERRPYQFLYKEGEDYIFMNQKLSTNTLLPTT